MVEYLSTNPFVKKPGLAACIWRIGLQDVLADDEVNKSMTIFASASRQYRFIIMIKSLACSTKAWELLDIQRAIKMTGLHRSKEFKSVKFDRVFLQQTHVHNSESNIKLYAAQSATGSVQNATVVLVVAGAFSVCGCGSTGTFCSGSNTFSCKRPIGSPHPLWPLKKVSKKRRFSDER